MLINPTTEILQQIKDSGVPIIELTLEEFQKITSEGKLITNQDVKKILEKSK